ncbi:Uncharacterised protein [Rothia dentocariosa]|uniref:Uncharacterized protein n=1 Tax=Rothia dentocariosa TaxID=2047 RepID=A0A448UWN7_9MICC|nr:Uncharacterised protein [Rothia dentocariosa]
MKTKKIATFGAVAALSCGLVGGFTTIPAAFADQSVPQSVSTPTNAGHSYSDGAVISFPSEWKEGQPLNFKGSGFKTADGKSGSVLAIKVNGGGALTKVEADENGNVSGSVPWSEGLKVGDQVEINVLTGSLKEGDVKRGGAAATVEVVGEGNDQKANEQSSSSLPGGGNDNTDQGDKKDESGKGGQGATGDEQKKTEEQGTQTEATKQAADSDSSSQTVTANQSADVNTPPQLPMLRQLMVLTSSQLAMRLKKQVSRTSSAMTLHMPITSTATMMAWLAKATAAMASMVPHPTVPAAQVTSRITTAAPTMLPRTATASWLTPVQTVL